MRKRTYTLAAVTLVAAATIASGRAAVAPLLGSEQTQQTIAGSKGGMADAARDPSIAGSKGDKAGAGRDSSLEIAGSKGEMASAGRDSS